MLGKHAGVARKFVDNVPIMTVWKCNKYILVSAVNDVICNISAVCRHMKIFLTNFMLFIVHAPEMEYKTCSAGTVKLYRTYSAYPMSGVWPILTRRVIFREPQWIKIEYNTKDTEENWVE
jgi:hypothetical protein